MSATMLAAARKLGEVAAKLGHPVTRCPYNPDSAQPVERAAARAYVVEFLRHSEPAPVSYHNDAGDAVDVDADGVARHFPGLHDQSHHGRRYKVPGDKSSGVREPKSKAAAGGKPAAATAASAKKAAPARKAAAAEGKPAAAATAAPSGPTVRDTELAVREAADQVAAAPATPTRADRIAAKESELAKATEALNAEGSRQAGTSGMRGKQHGQRIDAQIKRLATLSETVRRLERELDGLRRQPDQPAAPAKVVTAQALAGAQFVRYRGLWYEVVKVNRTTVGVKGRDPVKISGITDFRGAPAEAAAATAAAPAAAPAGGMADHLGKALANAARRREEVKAKAAELTIDGAETAFVPGARSTIGLADRPNVGRDTSPATQQLGLFADVAQEERDGQGALLDALLNPQALADEFLNAGKGGKR